MHEFSVCQSLLDQVSTIAAQHHAHAVTQITLQIGPYAGVEPRLLCDAFEVARLGTVADKAELSIETQPVRVHCETCGEDSEAAINRLVCASCGDYHTRLISGDELLLASVELENDAPVEAGAGY